MRIHKTPFVAAAATLLTAMSWSAQAQSWKLNVQVDKPGVKISPLLYGLMTEEINYSYDGGLYAELIRNRVFKDSPDSPVNWSLIQDGGASGSMALDQSQPLTAELPVSLKLNVAAKGGRVGVANTGYWGIPVRPRTSYRASFYARTADGFNGPITVGIESNDGKTVFAKAQVKAVSGDWKKYTVTLKTGNVTPSLTNRFVVSASTPGTVYLNLVSLFPPTYKNRPNGNRIDLMQKMADMHPTFLRFPGGNFLDPGGLKWKITRGPLENRPGHPGAWTYRSSDGLGIMEFMHWCEDLNLEPVLGVSVGRGVLPANGDITPYVQDALDQIEYLTGPATSTWGAKRVADGHPQPFALRYVEIGNEDFFDPLTTYNARFARFYDALKARYPAIQLIATRSDVSSRKPDIIDEHYYQTSAQMQRMANRYDTYDRSGPKIFVGEWASQDVETPWTDVESKGPTPSFNAAIGDAAWMIGMERNSDIVIMQCYAPLFVNVNPGGRQWAVNLIGYDALNSFNSPSVYAQAMFGKNRGDTVLPVTLAPVGAPPKSPVSSGGVGVGTWVTQAEFKDIRVSNESGTLYTSDFTSGDAGWTKSNGQWKVSNGAIAQSSNQERSVATVGNPNWTDYTYTLKARKTGGNEGFLVLVHSKDADNYVWWNIGGWNNTQSAVEQSSYGDKKEISGPRKPLKIEMGRWYDIRVEVKGDSIKCYLDGQLIHDVKAAPVEALTPLHYTASRDLKSGDIILKVVNVEETPQNVQLNLAGAGTIKPNATVEVLTGPRTAVNTLAVPDKVAPRTYEIKNAGPTFNYEFPALSVSVIRLKTK